ncbi:MAG: hypothetical protein KIS91_04390 [Anaerolineae bacterium]|nr:hypothetical protein [Anaerolineae bacterium]
MSTPRWLNSRQIERRIVIRGDLILETPARLGNGDTDGLVDMPLLLDPLQGMPLLTGASIAGALRSYLQQREVGYWAKAEKDPLTKTLFGLQEGDNGKQSWLIVDDSLGVSAPPLETAATTSAHGDETPRRPRVELRDGVAIDPETRTAAEKKKYDFEALQAGTRFPLRLELLVREKERDKVLRGVALALQGLERGEIPIGGRKRRGLGQCRVQGWEVIDYDLTDPQRLVAWLDGDESGKQEDARIAPLLGLTAEPGDDGRVSFCLDATFDLDGSLLIRSAPIRKGEPDFVHLRSRRGNELKSIVSGTSLAGALRARALRIARTVAATPDKGATFIDDMFGPHISDNTSVEARTKPAASRLTVAETEIRNPLHLVQTRVKIDRFTGGAFPTGLFSEEPVFSQAGTRVCVSLDLQGPCDGQIGLLLLLLKDLWLGDLPLGGESSVGRGRLKGKEATLTYRQGAANTPETWTIQANGAGLTIVGDADKLQGYVDAFIEQVTT